MAKDNLTSIPTAFYNTANNNNAFLENKSLVIITKEYVQTALQDPRRKAFGEVCQFVHHNEKNILLKSTDKTAYTHLLKLILSEDTSSLFNYFQKDIDSQTRMVPYQLLALLEEQPEVITPIRFATLMQFYSILLEFPRWEREIFFIFDDNDKNILQFSDKASELLKTFYNGKLFNILSDKKFLDGYKTLLPISKRMFTISLDLSKEMEQFTCYFVLDHFYRTHDVKIFDKPFPLSPELTDIGLPLEFLEIVNKSIFGENAISNVPLLGTFNFNAILSRILKENARPFDTRFSSEIESLIKVDGGRPVNSGREAQVHDVHFHTLILCCIPKGVRNTTINEMIPFLKKWKNFFKSGVFKAYTLPKEILNFFKDFQWIIFYQSSVLFSSPAIKNFHEIPAFWGVQAALRINFFDDRNAAPSLLFYMLELLWSVKLAKTGDKKQQHELDLLYLQINKEDKNKVTIVRRNDSSLFFQALEEIAKRLNEKELGNIEDFYIAILGFLLYLTKISLEKNIYQTPSFLELIQQDPFIQILCTTLHEIPKLIISNNFSHFKLALVLEQMMANLKSTDGKMHEPYATRENITKLINTTIESLPNKKISTPIFSSSQIFYTPNNTNTNDKNNDVAVLKERKEPENAVPFTF